MQKSGVCKERILPQAHHSREGGNPVESGRYGIDEVVMDNIVEYMKGIGQAARAASRVMAQADTATKNRALNEIACALQNQSGQLLAANAKDVAAARATGLDAASVDRLTLTEKTLRSMSDGL